MKKVSTGVCREIFQMFGSESRSGAPLPPAAPKGLENPMWKGILITGPGGAPGGTQGDTSPPCPAKANHPGNGEGHGAPQGGLGAAASA